MKKTIFIFLSILMLLTACSTEEVQNEPKDVQTNTIEQESLDFISDALSEATDGYKLQIYASERDGTVTMSLSLKRTVEGADKMFAELLPITVEAAKNALSETKLSLYELRLGFLLYNAGLTETADEMISWVSDNLETGTLSDTINDVFKTDVSLKEVLDIYAEPEFGDLLNAFQGTWSNTEINTKLIIKGRDIYSVHYHVFSEDKVSEIFTFLFDFDVEGNLVVTNQHSQPRYYFTINETGQLVENGMLSDDEKDRETYEKISDSTEIPTITKEPEIGMSELEVISSTWGYPQKKNKTTTEYGIKEQWVYDKGYIYFADGVVTVIQER